MQLYALIPPKVTKNQMLSPKPLIINDVALKQLAINDVASVAIFARIHRFSESGIGTHFIIWRIYTKTSSPGVCISNKKGTKVAAFSLIMNRNEQINGGSVPFLMAGLACLVCLPLMYVTTRPLLWALHGQGMEWLLLSLFTFVPLSVTFMILYCSAWHRGSPRVRRIFSVIFSSCVIFGVDLLFVVFTVLVGCLIVALGRAMGGN